MNYQDYMVHLKICEYTGKPLTGKYKMMYKFLTELWDGMEVVHDSGKITLQKDGNWFFMNNGNYHWSGCYEESVCSFFMDVMDMNSSETQNFMKCMLEEQLKCVIGTLTDIEFRTVNINSYTSGMSAVFPWWDELINNVTHII